MDAVTVFLIIQPPLLVASALVLAWVSLPDANPLVVVFRPVWRVFTRRNYALYVAIGVLSIIADAVFTAQDEWFTALVVRWRGEDFTSLIHSVEGDTVEAFQRLTWMPLTVYLTWTYVIVFAIAVPLTAMVFDYLGDARRAVGVLAGLVANYLLVLPFYFFFPVREVHAYRPGGESITRLLLDDVHPAIIKVLRPMSGLDNCFPSFHTSLIVTMALFAWGSGRRAFRVMMAIMAASVVFSTLYLGIHWLCDVGAGVAAGVVAWLIGARVGARFRVTPPTLETASRDRQRAGRRSLLVALGVVIAVAPLVVALFWSVGRLVTALDRRRPVSFKVIPSERMQYRVSSWLGDAGTISVNVGPLTKLDDGAAYQVTYTLDPSPAVSAVYVMRGQARVIVDAATLLPREYEQRMIIGMGITGGEQIHKKLEYDQAKHELRYYKASGGRGPLTLRRARPVPPRTQHFASFLYYVRDLPMRVGDAIEVQMSDARSDVTVRATVLREENYTPPAGTERKALVLETITDFGNEEIRGTVFQVWLDRDERFPVRLDAKTQWGKISVQLVERTLSGARRSPQQ